MADVTEVDRAIRLETRSRDRVIADLARTQHGVVAHWQLVALGLGPDAIQRWVRNWRLHRIHRGVYALGHRAVSSLGYAMAAALAYGEGALVGYRSASWLWDVLDDTRQVIDVVAVAKRQGRRGICFHSTASLHPDDVAERHGIPVTSLARTLLDIAEVVPRRRLVYALERAEKARVFDLNEIQALMARSRGRRGLKALTAAIRAIEPEALYSHDGLERLFIDFCRRRGLDLPAMNASVEGFTVDALWPDRKLIVELDSWEHHKSRRSFEEDRRRDALLGFAGYRIVRVTAHMLRTGPSGLAAQLSERLSLAATP
jgi:hypothetical protein